jgi:hypothetical protein
LERSLAWVPLPHPGGPTKIMRMEQPFQCKILE